MVFAIEDSPAYMMGAFDLMTWMTESRNGPSARIGIPPVFRPFPGIFASFLVRLKDSAVTRVQAVTQITALRAPAEQTTREAWLLRQ